MPDAYLFNLLECELWLAVSLILLVKSFRDAPPVRGIFRWLSAAFLLFGFSDFIEAHTGAWWRPLWLLALKGGCIAVFVFGFGRYFRLTNSGRGR